MKKMKWFAGMALAVGMGFAGAPALSAAQPDWRDNYGNRWDLRSDYVRIDQLRADVARDRARLDEDIRCGQLMKPHTCHPAKPVGPRRWGSDALLNRRGTPASGVQGGAARMLSPLLWSSRR